MDKNCKGDHNCQHRDRDAQTVVDCGDGTCGKMTGPTFGNQPLLLCAPKFDAGEKPGCKQKDGNTICRSQCVQWASRFCVSIFGDVNKNITRRFENLLPENFVKILYLQMMYLYFLNPTIGQPFL